MATPRTGRPVILRRAVTTIVILAAGVAGISAVTPAAPAAPPAPEWVGPPPPLARPGAGQAEVVGVVTDEANRQLDDISVEAWAVVDGVRSRVPAASALTYEGGRHHHGFYRLHVPAGRYVVTYRSGPHSGARYLARTYTRRVQAPGRHVVTLDRVRMQLSRRATAKVGLRVTAAATSARQRGRVLLVITSRDVKPVLGDVKVLDRRPGHPGRTLVSGRLLRASNGHVALRLPRLTRGRHVLVADYVGAVDLRPATQRLVVLVGR